MSYIFAGDSWALKGFTEENYGIGNNNPMPGDIRLADHWGLPYKYALAPGKGNLSVLDKILELNLANTTPIIWVYTEPGRDYGRITGKSEFDWLTKENIFEIRQELDTNILQTIRSTLDNPIGLIGGLSDIDILLAEKLGFTVLHPSWQKWIAEQLKSNYFQFGWGASDVGWRADYNNIKPSKTALFAWDELIKEWCWWADEGYFSHEHPSPRATLEFAKYLESPVKEWLSYCE